MTIYDPADTVPSNRHQRGADRMSRTWPNVQPSVELAHRIVRLLGEKTPESLAEARRLAARLAETIPQMRQARDCGEYRQRMRSNTCLDRTCGRCGPLRP